uniref:Death domain-containing protein n=1 Tax=Eptatretus burgeri TaxID=7764 RepID=A0A8C4NFW3_EPTBU
MGENPQIRMCKADTDIPRRLEAVIAAKGASTKLQCNILNLFSSQLLFLFHGIEVRRIISNVAKRIVKDWKMVVRSLGVCDDDIDCIVHDNSSSILEQAYQLSIAGTYALRLGCKCIHRVVLICYKWMIVCVCVCVCVCV